MDSEITNRLLKVVEDSISTSLKLYGKLNETRIEILQINKEINDKIEWLANEVKETNNLLRVRPCMKNSPDGIKLGEKILSSMKVTCTTMDEIRKENRILKYAVSGMTLVAIVVGIYLKN